MVHVCSFTRWGCAGLLLTGCVVMFQPSVAQAQTQSGGALAGTVLDPQGKVVVDGALVIRHESTGEVRTGTTDANGHFSAGGLAPGLYSLEVAVPGFDIVRRTGVVVG